MQALKFFEEKGLTLVEVPKPEIQNGEVLVRITACAICGSDARILKGEKKAKKGVTLGHEICGIIEESKASNFLPGERVVVFPSVFCGSCEMCLNGHHNLCENKQSLGYMLDGGFAEFLRVPRRLIELGGLVKTKIKTDAATLVEPFSCVLNSFESLKVTQKDRLLIIGAGPLGLMHLIAAKFQGVEEIFVVEHHPHRREKVKEIYEKAETAADIKEFEKKRPTKIFLCAFCPELLDTCVKMLAPKGAINIFAGGSWEKRSAITLNEVHYKEKFITGTHSTRLDLFTKAEKLVHQNKELFEKLITHKFPLEKYKEAFKTYTSRKGLKVILKPQ